MISSVKTQPPGWSLAKLADLGEVARGKSKHRPRYDRALYGGPYPFVQTGDIKESGGRVTKYTQTYSEAGLAQSRLWPAGTVCITIAANIAETAILGFPACFPDSVVGFIPDPERCDGRFVEYTFRRLRAQIQAEATGTVQDNINLETLHRLNLPIPPLQEQRAIARVLGDLDDKIELNRRTNETLEAMARALFRSWFVDFDPVRAKMAGRKPGFIDAETAALFPDTLVDSQLGEIPAGWRVTSLGDVMELKRGYDLPERERRPGRIPIVSSSGLSATHCEAKARGPGIVTGRYGTIGKVFYVAGDYWPLNTTLYVRDLRGNDILFAYQLLRLVDFAKFSDKAAVPGINRNHLHEEPVVLPPVVLQQRFGAILSGWTALSAHKDAETNTLAVLRDVLLPRLLSGELRVSA